MNNYSKIGALLLALWLCFPLSAQKQVSLFVTTRPIKIIRTEQTTTPVVNQPVVQAAAPQPQAQPEPSKTINNDNALTADEYYIAYLLKTKQFNIDYREEIKSKYNGSVIVAEMGNHTDVELLMLSNGHSSEVVKYQKQ